LFADPWRYLAGESPHAIWVVRDEERVHPIVKRQRNERIRGLKARIEDAPD
jgi:hypothetical protein